MIKSSKSAFTMIELVFVIVILGILTSLAIPKLNSTRDDARNSSRIALSRTCVNDAISSYKGRGVAPDLTKIPSCVVANSQGATITIDGDFVKVQNSGLDSLNKSYRMKGLAVIYN